MNTERLLKLADDLEASALPEGFVFDMCHVLVFKDEITTALPHACNTTSCMGGFSMLKYLEARWEPTEYSGW